MKRWPPAERSRARRFVAQPAHAAYYCGGGGGDAETEHLAELAFLYGDPQALHDVTARWPRVTQDLRARGIAPSCDAYPLAVDQWWRDRLACMTRRLRAALREG